MTEVAWAEVAALLSDVGWTPDRLVPVAPDQAGDLPEAWGPVVGSGSAQARCTAAYDLWNAAFVAAVPTFWTGLRAVVGDVTPVLLDGRPALVYAGARGDRSVAAWLGRDPRDDTRPAFWANLPEALRAFLDGVHGGFTAVDGETCGPLPPFAMRTLAAIAGAPDDGIPGWSDGTGRPDSTRLLRIATNGGNLDYCVSPDLPAGEVALVYEGDVDPAAFAPALDELMASYVDAD